MKNTSFIVHLIFIQRNVMSEVQREREGERERERERYGRRESKFYGRVRDIEMNNRK